MADGGMNAAEVNELCGYAARIAHALEVSNKILEANSQLCREDLDFRREQATKADAEKEAILKMFMGGGQPQPEPFTVTRRRGRLPRHEHPEPPEAA